MKTIGFLSSSKNRAVSCPGRTCLRALNRARRGFAASLALVLLTVWSCGAAAPGQIAVQIGQNFTASTDTLAAHPCPVGAVTEDCFVAFNIDTLAVYNKADGSVVEMLFWNDFWSQAGLFKVNKTERRLRSPSPFPKQ